MRQNDSLADGAGGAAAALLSLPAAAMVGRLAAGQLTPLALIEAFAAVHGLPPKGPGAVFLRCSLPLACPFGMMSHHLRPFIDIPLPFVNILLCFAEIPLPFSDIPLPFC